MYIATKRVIRDKEIKVRIKSLNWDGTRCGLEVDGEIVSIGSKENITELYNNY